MQGSFFSFCKLVFCQLSLCWSWNSLHHCLQGGTIIGQPDKIEDIGETQIPQDLFFEYLFDLGPQFTYATYWHCNRVQSPYIFIVIVCTTGYHEFPSARPNPASSSICSSLCCLLCNLALLALSKPHRLFSTKVTWICLHSQDNSLWLKYTL